MSPAAIMSLWNERQLKSPAIVTTSQKLKKLGTTIITLVVSCKYKFDFNKKKFYIFRLVSFAKIAAEKFKNFQ